MFYWKRLIKAGLLCWEAGGSGARPEGDSMDRGDGIQNLQKMVQAAKMYYQEGLTQETIAKKLRTSRPAVSLLLAEARSARRMWC